MASNDPNKNQDPGTNQDPPKDDPGKDTSDDGGDDKKTPWDEFKEKKGFKDEDAFIKSYEDMESNTTKLSEKAAQAEKWYPHALAFSSYLKSDPKAMEAYKVWAKGKDESEGDDKDKGEGDDDKGDDKPTVDTQARKGVDNLLVLEKDRIVNSFDENWKLSKLPNDVYKKLTDNMAMRLRTWGIDLEKPTPQMLKSLPRAMKDALFLARGDDKDIAKAIGEDPDKSAKIGTIPSVDIPPADISEETLSEKEKKAAENMGLTNKEYAEEKKKIAEEAEEDV